MPERAYRTRRQTLRAQSFRRDTSATERRLWLYLRRSQLGAPFRRQHPIGPFFLDYYCVPLKLAVEVDGPWHDAERDASRDAYLKTLGVTVMRFTTEEVSERIEGVVALIEREILFRLNAGTVDGEGPPPT